MKWLKLFWLTIYRLIKMENGVVVFDESTSIDLDDVVWVSIGEYLRTTTETDEFGTLIVKTQPIIIISTISHKYEFPHEEPYISAARKCQTHLNKKPRLKR